MKETVPKIPDVVFKDSMETIPHPNISNNSRILFSYELVDTENPYYNLNSCCDRGIQHWVDILKQISLITCIELHSGKYTHGSLRFHRHDHWKELDIPDVIRLNQQLGDYFVQFHFSKSSVVHGVLIDNVFYIIWFDPRHLYHHDEKYGPKKALNIPGQCCEVRNNMIKKLIEDNSNLKQENKNLYKILEEKTQPASNN